jgi:hypothetical protein
LYYRTDAAKPRSTLSVRMISSPVHLRLRRSS